MANPTPILITAKDTKGKTHSLTALYWTKLLYTQGLIKGASTGAISSRRRTSEKNNNCYTPEQIVGTQEIFYNARQKQKTKSKNSEVNTLLGNFLRTRLI